MSIVTCLKLCSYKETATFHNITAEAISLSAHRPLYACLCWRLLIPVSLVCV
jgi:hypothetical protein